MVGSLIKMSGYAIGIVIDWGVDKRGLVHKIKWLDEAPATSWVDLKNHKNIKVLVKQDLCGEKIEA